MAIGLFDPVAGFVGDFNFLGEEFGGAGFHFGGLVGFGKDAAKGPTGSFFAALGIGCEGSVFTFAFFGGGTTGHGADRWVGVTVPVMEGFFIDGGDEFDREDAAGDAADGGLHLAFAAFGDAEGFFVASGIKGNFDAAKFFDYEIRHAVDFKIKSTSG